MYACYNVEETDMLEALQMRDLLTPDGEEWIPWPDNIKMNGMEFYIRLIWEFQSVVEDRMEAVPNEKGVRAFSLFPVSTSFTNLHIVINGTTLTGFVSRIRDRGQGNLMEDWNMPQVKISTASFKVMRRAFAIDRFETRKEECPLSKTEFLQLPVEEKYEPASHRFANDIKTDGYSASVLYSRPKHEELGGEDDSLVPEGYSPDVVIGLDPGMRSVCTAARNTFDYKLHDDVVGEMFVGLEERTGRKVDPSVNCGENAISQSGYAVQSVLAIATTETSPA
ncbi:hypothetical protein PI126_g16092 [Phytophthora idaei]|nr:hypothetical protein PI126_g16092 [Phytophthora idaei]